MMSEGPSRWLAAAVADVRARGLDGAVPVLEAFAGAMTTLRAADWNIAAAPLPACRADDRAQSAASAPSDAREDAAPAAARSRAVVVQASGEPHTLDISTASERIRRGELTSLALTESCLAADRHAQPRAQRVRHAITRDEALAAARAADAEIARGEWRGPLHGIPISLKDLIDQRGVVTTAGSRVPDAVTAAADAPVTAALRQAGAVLVGKTNLHEFAFGTTSDESAFGPVRHPLDRERSPGGSSGGSAVAVATGMSLASIGTDTGGSIRIPAAACGLVGLKPGFGELSCAGVVPLSHTLDHVGPIARTVTDAAIVYRVLAGLPPEELTSRPAHRGSASACCASYFEELLEPDVRASVVRVQRAAAGGRRLAGRRAAAARPRYRRSLPRDRLRRGRGDSRRGARSTRRSLSTGRAPAPRGRPLRAGRRLPARTARSRGDSDRSGSRPRRLRRADGTHAADRGAADRGQRPSRSRALRIRFET